MSSIETPHAMMVPGAAPLAVPSPGALAGAGASADSGGLTARDMWRVITQRKLMIILLMIIFYALAVASTLLVWKFWPAWGNEAHIALLPQMKTGSQIEQEQMPKEFVLQELSTEAALIKDKQVLASVLALAEIKETKFYKSYPDTSDGFDKCLDDFHDDLVVAPVRDTKLVRVAIAVPEKKEARLIVNKVVETYVGSARQIFTRDARDRLDVMKRTLAAGEKELNDLRLKVNALRQQRDMPAVESERDVISENLAVLENTLSELKTRESDVEAQLQTMNGVDYRNLPLSAEMRVIIEADPVLRYWRQMVENMDVEIEAALRTQYGNKHRAIEQLRERRTGFAARETARREELIDDLRSRQFESLAQERARIRNMMLKVGEEIAEKENHQKDLDATIQQYKAFVKDEERLSRELEKLGGDVRTAQSAVQILEGQGRLKPIFASKEPIWPARPNLVLFLGGGLVLSVLLAVGFAFLREFTDQAIRTPVDIARHGRLSVLGSVPLLDDEETDIDQIENATRAAPHSLVAEAFRQIRTHLTFSGPLESQQALLITSPRPEDGKTAIAVNLGVAFAQGNQRVLLIDCNFRRPGVRNAFRNTQPNGLSNVLIGQVGLAQAVTRTEVVNLDVLTTGPLPPNPAELLGSQQMRNLLAEAKQQYDRILLDGPPCLLISDALVLATQVDAVLLVARAANSSKGAVRRSREQLARVGARVIGGVLNGVQVRPGGYFRQQYREYYDYTDQGLLPGKAGSAAPELEAGPEDDADRPRR